MLIVPKYTLLTVLIVDLLATSGDITLTWSSPVLPKLHSNDSRINPFGKPISENEESWIESLINIGAVVGPLLFGLIAQNFGRKKAILSVAIPHIASSLILAFSKTIYLYYFARVLGGLAVGGGYALLPMYIAEISQDYNRGMFSSTLNIFWSIGNLIPYIIGPYISIFWFNIILACLPTTFFVLFVAVAPESPYYLVMKKETEKAEKVLMILRPDDKQAVDREISKMQIEMQKNEDNITLIGYLRTKVYLKGLFLSTVLILSQQLRGVNAILGYTQEIFTSAGTTILRPELSSIVTGLAALLVSVGTTFTIDRLGRKILLVITDLLTIFSLFTLGIYFYLKNSTSFDVSCISWLPLICLLTYAVVNSIAGPIPWIVSSELFPTNVKLYSATIVSCTFWTASFLVTKFFVNLKNGIGVGQTFWLFAGFTLVLLIFVLLFLPETKGKSFQEIQEILGQACQR